MSRVIRSLGVVILVAVLFWLGVLLHEAGHIVSALAFGAHLTGLNVLGLDLVPRLAWNPLPGYYGYTSYQGHIHAEQEEIVRLWGSLSTFSLALIAQAVLWLTRPRRGIVRLTVLTLCFFWVDMLVHTLPTLGIPSYLFFGTRTITSAAEAYLAAVALGLPGWLFQVLAVGLSLGLLLATLIRWYLLMRFDRLKTTQMPTGEAST